ncbi:hypothetical protein EGI11_05045 [Chryseobacterium sp. H3056]|uniref:Uncharacterized protein n=1 Tax=Kaistella daneshvariae TaxID=2487074 RepID=A0A3N0WXI7_9FLAO|nr:hypothetical protein EGI11_05045 [Kaistella daneshvariae]
MGAISGCHYSLPDKSGELKQAVPSGARTVSRNFWFIYVDHFFPRVIFKKIALFAANFFNHKATKVFF